MMLLLLLLLLPIQPSPDARFAEGNARYEAGDYAGARTAYTQVIAGGQASAALYLNLADAYFRLDSLGQSIRYLEKARVLSPSDARVAHNLRIVRARLDLSDPPVPPRYWEAGARWLHRNVSPLLLFGLGALFFFTALTLGAWRAWTGNRNPWVRRGLLVLLPLAVLLIGAAFALSAGVGVVERAVVLRPVPLESDAGEAGNLLQEGRVLPVTDREAGRVKVVLRDGTSMWVASDAVGEI